MSARRVVSLVPSITETLLAWSVEPAGVTRFCEAPGVPAVGGTKNPDVDAIVGLRPDVVLMDREENRREDFDALEAAGLEVVATAVRSVADVAPALDRLAAAVGVPAADGADAVVSGPHRATPLRASPVPVRASRVRAFVPIWRRPWMSIGAATYGSDLLAVAGFDNVFAPSPDPYPSTDLDVAAALEPAVVLAPSEPYPFKERHRAELEAVAPVELVDGQDLFWWGVRTPAAVARFAQLAARLLPA